MSIIKKQNAFGWVLCGSIVFSLVGLIIYIVTSTVGYLDGQSFSVLPIIFTILFIAGGSILFIIPEKLGKFKGLVEILMGALISVSICWFILNRVDLAADVYFIPVNYPEAEETALSTSIVGMVFYLISIVGLVVVSFTSKTTKDNLY